jgi:hypothetical protein
MWLNQNKLLMQTTDRIDDKHKDKKLDHLRNSDYVVGDICSYTGRCA